MFRHVCHLFRNDCHTQLKGLSSRSCWSGRTLVNKSGAGAVKRPECVITASWFLIHTTHSNFHVDERIRRIEEENRRLYERLQYCIDEIQRASPGRSVCCTPLIQRLSHADDRTCCRMKIVLSVSNHRSNGRTTINLFAHQHGKTP